MKKTEKREVRDGLMQTVVRLRELRMKADEADGQRGVFDGMAWAMKTADVRELQALAEVGDGFRDPNPLGAVPGLELAEELAQTLNMRFGSELSRDDVVAELFTSPIAINSASYVVGFVTAALGVWNEVEAQVMD